MQRRTARYSWTVSSRRQRRYLIQRDVTLAIQTAYANPINVTAGEGMRSHRHLGEATALYYIAELGRVGEVRRTGRVGLLDEQFRGGSGQLSDCSLLWGLFSLAHGWRLSGDGVALTSTDARLRSGGKPRRDQLFAET